MTAGSADVVLYGVERDDQFGTGLTAGPDLDADGHPDLFVGAPIGADYVTGGMGYTAWIPSSGSAWEFTIANPLAGGEGTGGVGASVDALGDIVAIGTYHHDTYFLVGASSWVEPGSMDIARIDYVAAGVLHGVGDKMSLSPDMDGNGTK